MAYRKRRRLIRRPKTYRRKYRKTGLKRKLSNSRAYLFKRWVAYSNGTFGNRYSGFLTFDADKIATMTLSNVAGSVSYGSLSLDFQLRDLVDYTDFTTLYDKYKLAFVKVRIIPLATSVSTAAAYSSVFSQSSMIIHSILDSDDNANAPPTAAGVDQLRQYQTYKVANLIANAQRGVTRVVRPSILMAVNDSAGTAVGSRISKGWLNLGNSSVPHFGIKYIFEGISGGSGGPVNGVKVEMKIEAKFYLAFKEVR